MPRPALSSSALDALFAEDVPYGDLTTLALGIGAVPGRMVFRARGAMRLCGTEEAAGLIERAGGRISDACPSGADLAPGDTILSATGPAEALLAGWKVAQTLVEATSGIATAAARIVAAARAVDPGVSVACTRKTFPGTKALAIKAIVAGGALPHRLGLSETVLLFPEHRAFLPGLTLAEIVAGLRRTCPERKIVVEVTAADQANEAAAAGADVVQLEKFTPAQVADTAQTIGTHCVVAAAGGVNAANAAEYARAGARVLVSSSPYWAPPADVAVTIAPA